MFDYKIIFFIFFEFFILYGNTLGDTPLWEYQCIHGNCRRIEIKSNETSPQSLDVCRMFCGDGILWPRPSRPIHFNDNLVNIDFRRFRYFSLHKKTPVGKLIKRKIQDLKSNLQKFKPVIKPGKRYPAIIRVMGLKNYSDTSLTLETDESYDLRIHKTGMAIRIDFQARNYFGLRHAFETLEQLIFFNDVTKHVQIPEDVWIVDKPSYPYRGVMLDTSRNYIDKSAIMKTIKGMGMSKLNTLHWHITDQHSFPYVSHTWPNMSRYGAYSPSKVYTAEDIKEIKEFGIYHGVRVLPEMDAPAHVSEGWQWIDEALLCYREIRWQHYCSGPPCGQLNPLNEKVYEILEGLYKDMLADFGSDIFHMGGDQVNKNCWDSSADIRRWANTTTLQMTNAKFIELWNIFQARAYDKLKTANGGKDKQVILWSSDLTKKDNLDKLDNKTYIIQNWYGKDDTQTVADLVNAGFRVIFSHYDVYYLDCGFGSHMNLGTNWCSPYNDWRTIYEYSPFETLEKLKLESKKDLIFGGEVILWSESVDSSTLDSRLWPRAAALAGRLWNDQKIGWRDTWKNVESRMILHRNRLVDRGILAQAMAPEWCHQNQGLCRFPLEWDVDGGSIIYYGDY